MSKLTAYFGELFSAMSAGWCRFWFQRADAATASLVRIIVGVAALAYLLTFTSDLIGWFGPNGILPRETTMRLLGPEQVSPTIWQSHPSLLWLSESPSGLWTIHIVGLIAIGMMTVGAMTRLATIVSAVIVLSYYHRAPMLAGQLEPVLTMLLFYLCFTRCGDYFSIDAWRRKRSAVNGETQPSPSLATHIGMRLIQIHLAGLYLVLALNKLAGEPWWNGDAMWWLIAHRESRLINLTWLHSHPLVVDAWTHGVVLFELIFPLLIWNKLARPLLLSIGVIAWVMFGAVTGQLTFCLLMSVVGVAFIPPESTRFLAT